MIKSWKRDADRRFYEDGIVPKRAKWASIERIVSRKLDMIHAATSLDDLRIPPNNRLEALKGDRKGQHSIRINDQWRICFVWKAGSAHEVEIVNYH